MFDALKAIAENTNPRVLGQVLKSQTNRDLLVWLMDETKELIDASFKERVWFVLNGKPQVRCHAGNKKTFNPKTNKYGFCNSANECICMRAHLKDIYQPRDMVNVTEKRKATWLRKYGVDNASKSETVKTKRKNTMSARDYTPIYDRLAYEKQTAGFDQIVARVEDTVIPKFSRDEYKGCFRKNKYRWECKECTHEFKSHVDYGTIPRCPICYPKAVSLAEIEISNFIRSLGIEVENNDRSILNGLELDIYIPKKNIAIEYNGIYWHSSSKKTPTYHVDKYLACKKIGIHLIQIFEDEWIRSKDIIKSRLTSVLGLDTKIGARKCNVVALSTKEFKDFTEAHHLAGYANSAIKYGLVHEGKIVAVMGFSKSRYTKEGFELIRYCSAATVVGGAGKLLTHFIKQHRPDSILTYADRCWSNGALYKAIGFTDVTSSERNTGYWYIKDNKRYHRSNFTKSRLVKLGYEQTLTESEIMANLGYLKIHDAGNYKFILVTA